MGKYIVYAVITIALFGGIFVGGVVVGGAWGSGMESEATVGEIEACMADAPDDLDITEYRQTLQGCLADARAAS